MKYVHLLKKNQIVNVTSKNAPALNVLFNTQLKPGDTIRDPVVTVETPTTANFELLSAPHKQEILLDFIRNKELVLNPTAGKKLRQNIFEVQKLCDAWLTLLAKMIWAER